MKFSTSQGSHELTLTPEKKRWPLPLAGIFVVFFAAAGLYYLLARSPGATIDQRVFSVFSNPSPAQAFVVGMLGSLSYYTALKFGFIVSDQTDTLLAKFKPNRMIVWFCLIGGSIAGIFQLAQISTFAPIQALVLGITWPTLVSQYVVAAGKKEVQDFLTTIRGTQ